MTARIWVRTVFIVIFATGLMLVPSAAALAVIFGGEGNDPLDDPGWPNGAARIFNTKTRIAWWEGPPFGGGQWHAECRGDAKTLTAVLADFAKLDVKSKRVILHDGIGHSFWLAPNNETAKQAEAKMDWRFMVWVAARWDFQRKLPEHMSATESEDAESGPPSQIEVYTGGDVRWADVTVPKRLKIVDQRLEAHGFTLADGVVLEGKVTDLATDKPLTAKMRLQRVEPQPKSGYKYTTTAETATDAKGRWVLKMVPAGWYIVVVEADGFVPRMVGYASFDQQPQWLPYDCGLARPATVTGMVADETGKPLADVEVSIQDVTAGRRGLYQSVLGYSVKTGADGRFRADQVPIGRATIWLFKPGYRRPGLGLSVEIPKSEENKGDRDSFLMLPRWLATARARQGVPYWWRRQHDLVSRG